MENKTNKILAIDDNQDNLIVLKALFGEILPSAKVLTALSGKQGIEICLQQKPDVILLDIVMPGMDGYEVCRVIKATGEIKHIPVIMITAARTDKESRIKALEAGADAFIAKPIDEAELTAQVNAMLRIKEAEDRKIDEKVWLEKLVEERTDALKKELEFRQNAELAILKSEERFKQVVETSGVWIWEVDTEGCYTFASSNSELILGYKPDEIIGKKHFYDFFDPLFKDELKQSCFNIFEKREQFKGIINPNIHKNGHRVILETSGLPIFDENGKFIGYRGADKDVSEAEIARQKIIASEEKFSAAFKNAPVLLTISEYETGRYLDVNKRFLEVSGFSREEVIGKTSIEIGLITPDDRKLITNDFVKFKKVTELELHLKKKSGEEIICLFNGELITVDGKDCILSLAVDITSSRGAEDALHESEYFFKESQRAAYVGSYKTDFITGFWESSEVLDQIFGIGKSYVRSIQGWLDIVHPADREMMSNYLTGEVAIQRKPFDKEYRIIRISDGKTRWLHGLGKATFDENGKIIMLTGTIQDITERKLAEQTILESELRFKNLFDSAADAIFIADAETGIILEANQASTRLMMMPVEKIVGLHQTQLHPPEYENFNKENFEISKARTKLNKQVKAIETQILRSDGAKIPVEVLASNVFIQGKQCVMGTFRNITERKRNETIQQIIFNIASASLSTTNLDDFMWLIKTEIGTLIDTTNFFVALYDEEANALTLPFYVDKKDNFTSFPIGKTMTGYVIKTGKSILARSETIARLEASGIIEKIGSPSKVWLGVPLMVKGKITGAIVVQSYENEDAFGHEDMKILEFVGSQISTAIERKRTEQELNDALMHAKESDRLKSSFLATMSHELRTPLNAVIGFSEIINEDLPLENIIDFARIIHNSGEHLLQIVEDIFDITLIESGQVKIKKEYFQLLALLTEVNEMINAEQLKLSKDNLFVNFKNTADDKDLMVFTDPMKLKQILMNLLKNGLKFTTDGFVEFGYRKVQSNNKPLLEFYVKDSGIGIPEESQEIIFEIFRQGDDSHTRHFGGTGIGLSMAKKLTEHLGGKIRVESKVGIGSTFYFTIPYTETSEDEPVIVERSSVKKRINFPGKTILIAEDENSNFELLEVLITMASASVIHAYNGEEAINFCKTCPEIDLVLMDLKMPGISGYQATTEIKKMRPNLPVIAQTAFAMVGDRTKAIQAGCDDYISKPVKKQQLMEIIDKYIGR